LLGLLLFDQGVRGDFFHVGDLSGEWIPIPKGWRRMRIVGAIYRLAEGGLSRKISYIDNKNRIAIFIALQRQVPGQKKANGPPIHRRAVRFF
jgi:hypothetical protein